MNKKRVLLTGAAGFAGSHILRHLLSNTDYDIVCVCGWEHMGTPERIHEAMVDRNYELSSLAKPYEGVPYFQRVEVITHDLSKPIPEMTKKRIGKCDYIINLAAESHVDRSITEPRQFIENNVGTALNMLEFAREYPPEMFIQFSTDEVYGVAPQGVNHKEWSPIVPSNPYSASKACQEAIAISYWRTYGVPVIITNTMNLFGETQAPEKYMAKIIRMVKEGESVPVHGKDGVFGSRYYLHARNMADAILFIMKFVKPDLYQEDITLLPERFNIVGDLELDNKQVAHKIAGVLGKSLVWHEEDYHTGRPGHDRRYALDGQKLYDRGWRAPRTFDESLKTYIEWTLKHDKWL